MRKHAEKNAFRTSRVPLYLTAALLVVLAGLIFPQVLLSSLRTSRLSGVNRAEIGTEIMAETSSAFEGETLTSDMLHDLIATSHIGDIYYHEPAPGEMTEAEAVSRLRLEMEEMEKLHLLPKGSADFDGAQYTAVLSGYLVGGTDARTFYPIYDIWEITIYRANSTIHAQLHAASGKILALEATLTNEIWEKLLSLEERYDDSDEANEWDISYEGLEAIYDRSYDADFEEVLLSDEEILKNPESYGVVVYDVETGAEVERISLSEAVPVLLFLDRYNYAESVKNYLLYLGLDDLEYDMPKMIFDEDYLDAHIPELNASFYTAMFFDDLSLYVSYQLY